MEPFVLRWTKHNLPFWQGIDSGKKIGLYDVANVIAELETYRERHRDAKSNFGTIQRLREENRWMRREIERVGRSLFTGTETGKDFYVNRVKYIARGQYLWVDLLADPVRT